MRLGLIAGNGAFPFLVLDGVRFYLHGDVIPDEPLKRLPDVKEETGKPLFNLRGIQPYNNFVQGPDWWSTDDYKTYLSQLVKMRMNFIGFHCYPSGKDFASDGKDTASPGQPTVWHGLKSDFDDKGRVTRSYPTLHYNTLYQCGTVPRAWSLPKKTSDYRFGGSLLFEREDGLSPIMEGISPVPTTLEACNTVFNRKADMLREVFTFARRIGVKTCIGTETPMHVPASVAERTQDVRAIYEGTFRRIMASHPLDYYWLWTTESWTWNGNTPEQYKAVVADIMHAKEALQNVNAPFQLATCGWVVGPGAGSRKGEVGGRFKQDRAAFGRDLPKDIAISAINQMVGTTPVDPAFGRITGREKWAIAWFEDDGGLDAVQLWAGRMRRDAADAQAYGCTGLMGLHWRTEILAPNVSALAQAAWDQSLANSTSDKPHNLSCNDFYADWSLASFGNTEVGKVFAALDGKFPRATLGRCPTGHLTPVRTPWRSIAPTYAFIDQLEKLRPRIHGPGNLDRFDYWLNTFKHIQCVAQLRCALAKPNPKELTRLYADAYRYLLATVNTPGAMGMVVNMENHPAWGATIAKHVKQPWPAEYQGQPRLIVPTVRSVIEKDETLTLKIIALDKQPVKALTVHLRPLGKGDWQTFPAMHIARGVYKAKLPPAQEDFEYYITADKGLLWPATAPQMNQTVVVTEQP